ncbi:HlyD family secretion protein [Fibrobacter sp. UWB16]|jgi:HlyD family secretion protein|uniref:HlyD family secretion protein n=1 Tax=unclassified Fibrobacter TaxID=2634177 RepID=UPI000B52091F|nr:MULTISPECIES: HlyD family secretion protein [unclassified Fibrobacter]MBP5439806.1 efflux RND transporter periplasmic adaptor subunit [Fibrobacter sp.]OWV17599.1 secretion protein HlyD [Fibrobacter sp. UWB3]SOD12927.1 HlyD family secretion protein [Fibrobacter sp. UWB16]
MNALKMIGKVVVVLALIVLVIMGISQLQQFATQPREQFLQGQMEARRVLVAGKVPGRIERLFVHEGDVVNKDSLVAVISSPEIEAKKMQAQGALGAAKAQASKARNGARSEDITALKAMADRAQEAATLAKNTYNRVQKLYNEGVLPLQKRDEAETQMKASQSAADAARAQYNQAVAGARSEDKAAANALVMQAKGANAEVDAYLEETKIRTPITGEVSLKLAEEGEVVGSGMPIIAVTDLNDSWAVFHLREDYLKNVSKGKKFYLQVPALDKTIEMVVSYIASVGDYATWRSSKESSGFDLKTFEVRMRPTHKVENLRPGMSVLLPADDVQ